jgi:hypothetical protein
VCTSPDGGVVRLTCGTAELGPDGDARSLLAAADEVLLRFKRPAERLSSAGPAGRPSENGD